MLRVERNAKTAMMIKTITLVIIVGVTSKPPMVKRISGAIATEAFTASAEKGSNILTTMPKPIATATATQTRGSFTTNLLRTVQDFPLVQGERVQCTSQTPGDRLLRCQH